MFKTILIGMLGFGCAITLKAQPTFNKSFELSGAIDGLVPVVTDSVYYYSVGTGYFGTFKKNIIVKFDLNGDTVMTGKFGQDSSYYYTGLSLLKDGNTFIMEGSEVRAGFQYPYAAKLDDNFDTLWTSKKWNLIPGAFFGVIKCEKSYYFSGALETGGSGNLYDIFVLKCDQAGNIIWQQTYPSSVDEFAYSIDIAENGNLILAGYQDSPTTSWNLLVTKIDTNGVLISGWPKTFGGTESEAGFAKTCNDGNYIVYGGWYSPVANAHLRKLDQNGNTIWFKNYQNPGAEFIIDEFYNLQELENGDFVLVGNYYDTTISDPSGWMIKTDSLGNEKWRRRIALRDNDNYLYGLACTPDGGFVMSGTLFPDGSGNTEDGWLVKVDSMGCVIMGCSVSIEEQDFISDVIVYPNPSNGNFYLETDNWQEGLCELFDVSGKLIQSLQLNSNRTEISARGETGIFILKVRMKDGVFSKKIIING